MRTAAGQATSSRRSSAPAERKVPPRSSSKKSITELRLGKRILQVSNLEKVYYPKTGFTKGRALDYYVNIAPAILQHLKDRPLTLKRYPEGVEGEFFYEKRCPVYRPGWVKTAPVWSEGNNATID